MKLSVFNRCFPWLCLAAIACNAGCGRPDAKSSAPVDNSRSNDGLEESIPFEIDGDVIHVFAGQDIQRALELATRSEEARIVRVHEGTFRPQRPGQAFLRFNAQHSGLTLEAEGIVTLTAENPDVANAAAASFPAVVNHIIYFGDGVSPETTVRGFRLTGANGYTHDRELDRLEPNDNQPGLQPALFYYLDGGAIKVFGRSWPTIENMTFEDNWASLCGGAISIEHRKMRGGHVTIRNSIFKNNNCEGTGAAIDVLEGSSAEIENCLFVANIANTGMAKIASEYGLTYNAEHGSGALTVFPGSIATVKSCTFTGNWNGVDDKGRKSVYQDCIFWQNNAGDGSRPGKPYEIDILNASGVTNCWLNGEISDLRGTLKSDTNHLEAPDPQFDEDFVPASADYAAIGYRPASID
jgi:hypothetical protein